MSKTNGALVPKMNPTNHEEKIRRFKPIEAFANLRDNYCSEYGELQSDEKL